MSPLIPHRERHRPTTVNLHCATQTKGRKMAQNLKLKVLTLITKLSDRDTYNLAATELESTAGTLDNTSLPTFISCLLSIDSADKRLDLNAQIGSALCLAAAIDAAPDPEPGRLGKALVPKLERLLKSDRYKAKSAGLVVMGSVIGRGLGSEEGSSGGAREVGSCGERCHGGVQSGCLKVFEKRKFDKVKAAREVMNQMIEAWKQVPDVSEDVSPPPHLRFLQKKSGLQRPLDWKVEVAIPNSTATGIGDNDSAPKRKMAKPETKWTLLSKNSDDKMLKFGGMKSGSRVVPCQERVPHQLL
ncbi:hypothetical protein GH714_040823 [Hevea brasiliensis]|uniref:TORTIFOLIA1/SINE1-2 N-terminal domain-containing protein n=1 Tax=Hevea brasiliensis TaxID=3981 RepID=A0A6A6MUD5_HEVBR|nr:hypothetical protein GH714_040823 [Hevea brasiliensis]